MSLKTNSIPEEKHIGGHVFPLTVVPNYYGSTIEESVYFVESNIEEILSELRTHGAILFRDFPIADPKDFNDFALAFGWEDLPYIGGAAVRRNIHGVVFTSNEAPPDQLIPFHHEMAQTTVNPSHLLFYCDVKPGKGGETPICLSNAVYEAMVRERPEFVESLRQKGVKYTRVLPEFDDPSSPIGRSWRSTYQTDDKSEVERKCTSDGGSFEWLPGNMLKAMSPVLPGVKQDVRTGKWTWFNSIVAVYHGWRDSRNSPEKAVVYGDGTPFDPEDVRVCARVMDELSVAFEWQRGDVLLIDNRLVLHARNCFDPPRRILAALFK